MTFSCFFFFKQKTAYEMRISDWSSDVCSSDLEAIFSACREWQTRFAPKKRNTRPIPIDKSPNRRLRIGMISDGFRGHPVGMMITPALEHLDKKQIELLAYSTNTAINSTTVRIPNTTTSEDSTVGRNYVHQ